MRDLVRARETLRLDLMRARHRLSKLVLRHGVQFDDGRAWTERHRAWLRASGYSGLHLVPRITPPHPPSITARSSQASAPTASRHSALTRPSTPDRRRWGSDGGQYAETPWTRRPSSRRQRTRRLSPRASVAARAGRTLQVAASRRSNPVRLHRCREAHKRNEPTPPLLRSTRTEVQLDSVVVHADAGVDRDEGQASTSCLRSVAAAG